MIQARYLTSNLALYHIFLVFFFCFTSNSSILASFAFSWLLSTRPVFGPTLRVFPELLIGLAAACLDTSETVSETRHAISELWSKWKMSKTVVLPLKAEDHQRRWKDNLTSQTKASFLQTEAYKKLPRSG